MLVKNLSSGDSWRQEHRFEQILKDYEALASKIARDYKNKGTDWEDLQQLAHIGLYQAYLRYDPDKAVKFSTYAVYWIKKQVLGAFSDKSVAMTTDENRADGRRSVPRTVNIASACDTTNPIATACDTTNPIATAYDTTASTINPGNDYPSLKLPLDMPPLEREIINLSIGQQLSLKEISDKLQLSVERIKQHKQKALRRLRAIHPGGV